MPTFFKTPKTHETKNNFDEEKLRLRRINYSNLFQNYNDQDICFVRDKKYVLIKNSYETKLFSHETNESLYIDDLIKFDENEIHFESVRADLLQSINHATSTNKLDIAAEMEKRKNSFSGQNQTQKLDEVQKNFEEHEKEILLAKFKERDKEIQAMRQAKKELEEEENRLKEEKKKELLERKSERKNRVRPHRIQTRLSDEEKNIFEDLLLKSGLKKEEYIRECILGNNVTITQKSEKEIKYDEDRIELLRSIYKALSPIGNNINQLAHVSNADKNVSVKTIEMLSNELKSLDKIKEEILLAILKD